MKCRFILFRNTKLYLSMLLVIIALLIDFSCMPAYAQKPHITKLEASYLYVYPMGTTELTCNATSANGDILIYKWSCTDGSIIGSGPTVTWKAPNKYGNFHIMVVVEDSREATDTASITIGVVANKNQPTCPTCGKK